MNHVLYLIWIDRRNSIDFGGYDLYFAYQDAISSTWSSNSQINDIVGSVQSYHAPILQVDSVGNSYAIWADNQVGGDVYFDYRPAGGSWGSDVNLTDGISLQQYSLDADLDDAGNLHVIWYDRDDNRSHYKIRQANGTWTAITPISNENYSKITVDSTGTAFLVRSGLFISELLANPDYQQSGSYVSPVLDTTITGAAWDTLSWQGNVPTNASLTFETRSRTPGSSWSEWVETNGGISNQPGQFLQYRVPFFTSDQSVTPQLDAVDISYTTSRTPSAPRFNTPCGITNQASPDISGSAAAGSTAHLYVDGNKIVTGTVSANGLFFFSELLASGTHVITATIENGNGVGSASTPLTITVDTSLPYDPISVQAGQWAKDGWLLSAPRDSDGCVIPGNAVQTLAVDSNGWRIWPRANEKFRLEIPVTYSTTASVTVTMGTKSVTLTEAFTGMFVGTIDPPFASEAFTLEVVADGNQVTATGNSIVNSDGFVYKANGTTGDTLENVLVTLYYLDEHSGQWIMWDAWNYEQVNPQITLANGSYSFYPPSGVYRVTASLDGYDSYTSDAIIIVDTPLRHNIPLDISGNQIYLPVIMR